MRYMYRTVEVDPASDKLQDVLDEYSRGGWRLVTVVPMYSSMCRGSYENEHQMDIYVGTARLIFEREREDG